MFITLARLYKPARTLRAKKGTKLADFLGPIDPWANDPWTLVMVNGKRGEANTVLKNGDFVTYTPRII